MSDTATPATKPTIFEALSAVMGDVQAVGKDNRNTQQNYQFRGIDAVVNAVGPALRKHGVIVIPTLEDASYRDVQTSTGKPSRECTVRVRYRFYGPDGSHIDAVVPGESMDFGDKGAPKAMSVAFRIALLQALAIPTHEQDPDAQSYEREERRSPSLRAVALFEAVTGAKSEDELKSAWTNVQGAQQSGEITGGEAGQLSNHIKRRKQELASSVAAPAAANGHPVAVG